MGNEIGAMKTAAKRIGMKFMEYFGRHAKGLRRCYICRRWKLQTEFYRDGNRKGLHRADCKKCGAKKERARIRDRRKA